MGLGVLLAEDGVAQVAKVLETALDIQVGHQAGTEVNEEQHQGRAAVCGRRGQVGAVLTSTGRGTRAGAAGLLRNGLCTGTGGPRGRLGTH